MRSPVSRRALGECNAIRNRGVNHSELTFVGILKSDSGAEGCRVVTEEVVRGPGAVEFRKKDPRAMHRGHEPLVIGAKAGVRKVRPNHHP
jgi:hypothetical protein